MAAPFNSIESKCDRAICAYLILMGVGTVEDTYPAKRASDKVLPNTTVFSQSTTEEPSGSGNHWVDCKIVFKSSAQVGTTGSAAGQKADSESRFGAIVDALSRKDPNNSEALPNAIMDKAREKADDDAELDPPGPDADLTDFTILGIVNKGTEVEASDDGDIWLNTISLSIYCCGSDVA